MNQKILELLAKEVDKKPEDMTDDDILNAFREVDNYVERKIIECEDGKCTRIDIIKCNDVFIQVTFFDGQEFDYFLSRDSVFEVKPVQKTITAYEPFC